MATISEGKSFVLAGAETVSTDVPSTMDPRLQRLIARRRTGMRELVSVSTGLDEIAVLAKVTDVSAWEGLSEVRVGTTLGTAAADGTSIVTGRIPVTRIESVRQQSFVTSLKAAQPLQLTLNRTIEETGARVDLLPVGHGAGGGAGVVMGVVDYGCDFVHQNFRDAAGGTRILAIWDQNGPSSPSSAFGYGKVYTQEQINAALQQPDSYQALGYGPAPDSPFRPPGTHGTHVADIAAGNGRGTNVPGVAPRAEIVFVDVSHSDLPFSGREVVGRSFGDSVRLLEALRYIFDVAGDRPCVINVSLGTNGGPHDGSTLVEQGIDRLVRAAPNRAVVIAASNSFADGIHAAGTIDDGGHLDLIWEIAPGNYSHNEFELWYDGDDRFAVELLAPGGQSMGRVDPGSNGEVIIENNVVIFIANRLGDPNNGDNMIGIFLEGGLPSGHWVVRLHAVTVRNGTFHAWIERDNVHQSRFAPPHDNTHTIGSISCGRETIVVGSYDAHKPNLPLSFFSSSGPTRDGREKPEISAPGHDVFAAHSRTTTGVVRKSGTSMAAPAVAGVIALLMAEAKARGISLSNEQVREILVQTARRSPPAGSSWDRRYGHGRVAASDAVKAIADLAGESPQNAGAKPKKAAAKKTGGTKKAKSAKKKAGKAAR